VNLSQGNFAKPKKIFLIIINILFLFTAGAISQGMDKMSQKLKQQLTRDSGSTVYPVWIYFSDKGPALEQKLIQAEQSLLPKALARRSRQPFANQRLVDETDLPLYKDYLKVVKNYVVRIRQKSRWMNALSVEVTKAGLDQLINLPFIKKIDLVFIATAPLPIPEISSEVRSSSPPSNVEQLNYGLSYAQNNQINIIPLHNLGYDGSGVLVAMLDAGFNNLEHQALRHLNILATWDFVNGNSVVWDELGQMGSGNHGTFTLSALAGFKEDYLIGPAYGADFILAKTEYTDWERHLEEDAWIAGAEWADSLGADIISSSLGYLNEFTNGDTNYTWQDMDGNTTVVTIGADIAASRGILVVNSAGNEGAATAPQNTLIAPADGDSVMAVGSVTESGSRSYFSSMGPTVDGRIKPDIMTRGSGTLCASPFDTAQYCSVSGTSLSCPLAAGAAALVWQVNPSFTNMQVLEALRNTASLYSSANNQYGWGIIDAYAAASPVTGCAHKSAAVLEKFTLFGNYPNPFNPVTTISYELLHPAKIQIVIFNALGERVQLVYSGISPAGRHQLKWEASRLGSGMYYVVLMSGEARLIRKALLLK
jgi:serine protease AprX